jgi:hypothetical protein
MRYNSKIDDAYIVGISDGISNVSSRLSSILQISQENFIFPSHPCQLMFKNYVDTFKIMYKGQQIR